MQFQNPPFSILEEKKLYIFDMDGTIYLGNRVFPFAIRFIKNYCPKKYFSLDFPRGILYNLDT